MKTAHKKNKRGKKDQLKRTHTYTQNRPIKNKKNQHLQNKQAKKKK